MKLKPLALAALFLLRTKERGVKKDGEKESGESRWCSNIPRSQNLLSGELGMLFRNTEAARRGGWEFFLILLH